MLFFSQFHQIKDYIILYLRSIVNRLIDSLTIIDFPLTNA